MIVADANLLIHLLLPGPGTDAAEAVHAADPTWLAPPIALSEVRNVLVTLMRAERLTRAQAHAAYGRALDLLDGAIRPVSGKAVLDLAATYKSSAYDAEYIALAKDLGAALVTSDIAMRRRFPGTCLSPEEFVA